VNGDPVRLRGVDERLGEDVPVRAARERERGLSALRANAGSTSAHAQPGQPAAAQAS
jgi:hypothetical protein